MKPATFKLTFHTGTADAEYLNMFFNTDDNVINLFKEFDIVGIKDAGVVYAKGVTLTQGDISEVDGKLVIAPNTVLEIYFEKQDELFMASEFIDAVIDDPASPWRKEFNFETIK